MPEARIAARGANKALADTPVVCFAFIHHLMMYSCRLVSKERLANAIGATSCDFAGGTTLFGRYTLIKVLGRGGMGVVWLARDEQLEREVALKFLPDLMIHDRALFDQLRRETKRSLELTHAHIIRIHDFVHDENSGCISMEYVDGETLSNLQADKQQRVFEPDEIAPWIGQLCDALDYAHGRARIIHCDLKPANLMLNQRGDLKIADFGIARNLAEAGTRLTAEQGRSGTLAYMSPQQLNGEQCTHLHDIYSMGATIYDLLTSKPPFYSGNIDRQICERVPPSMTERRKELNIEPALVPQIWEDTVAMCLAKNPSRRPQSAGEVAERLQIATARTGTTVVRPKRGNKKALVVAGIAAVAVLGLAGLYVGKFKRQPRQLPQAIAIPEKSIAVLPFDNRSEEKTNAYFADGIQDEILTRLSKIADLKVISRTSTQQYKSAPENLPEIARQLGVAHILEGSVQRSGDAVRVNVQLINAATDSHLWAETFDRKLTDIFSVESDIAKAVADQLRAQLTGQEVQQIASKPTANVEAYDAYLRGLAYTLKSIPSTANALGGQKYLREAVRLDPNFALSWALLSMVNSRAYGTQSLQPTAELREEARQAVETALSLQPNLGEAVLAKGSYYYSCLKDYNTALHYFEQAAQLLPNSSRIPESLAYVARRKGEWDRSDWYLDQAERLDPRNVYLIGQHASNYICQRRFPEALQKLDAVLDITPDDRDTLVLKAAIAQAQGDLPRASALLAALHSGGDTTAALETQSYQGILERRPADVIARLKEVLARPDPALGYFNADLRFWLGWAQEVGGDHVAARETWTQARSEFEPFLKEQPNNYLLLGGIALTEIGLGNKAAAMDFAERAIAANPIEKDALTGPIAVEFSARVAARMGDSDRAIAALQKLLSIPYAGLVGLGSPLTPALLRLDPMFDPIRNDPRFQKLVTAPK